MTRIRKRADERKIEIVETAIRLAGEIGPDRLTTERLAREAGISQPGIFRHFSSKIELWEAIAHHLGQMILENAQKHVRPDQTPAEQIYGFVLGQLSFIERTPVLPAILFSRELHQENESLRLYLAGFMADRHRHLAMLVAREIGTGRLRESLDPSDAAYLILSLIQGLAMRWSLYGRSFELAKEGRRLLDLLISGFGTHAIEGAREQKENIPA